MRIEAVVTCVDYDDFLKVALPYNLPHLDRVLVVTTPEDERTRHVCRRLGVECLQSRDGTQTKGEFHKGRLIERGLQQLSSDSWRLHIDADIVLPNHFRRYLELAELHTEMIYGADRLLVRGWREWLRLLATGYLHSGQHVYNCNLSFPSGFSIGSRWVGRNIGYVPIGFFQLWHSSQDEWSGIRSKPYPTKHGSACRTDVQHALQWDRAHRQLIPEFVCVHLESEPSPNGVNWRGRKTKRFEP